MTCRKDVMRENKPERTRPLVKMGVCDRGWWCVAEKVLVGSS
jgi:hypothetical protein